MNLIKFSMSYDQMASYTGITQNNLLRRITLHLQNGSVRKQVLHYHKKVVIRRNLVDNIKIIKLITDEIGWLKNHYWFNKKITNKQTIIFFYKFLIALYKIRKRLFISIKPKWNLDWEVLDNNEDFNDGGFLTSNPFSQTTINYIHRLDLYAEKVILNGQKYSFRSRSIVVSFVKFEKKICT